MSSASSSGPIDGEAPAGPVGPLRPGHGVVVVEQEPSGSWCAAWLDLGAVEVIDGLDNVLVWARAQPAAEHLLSVAGLGDMPLDGDPARSYLDSARGVDSRRRSAQVFVELADTLVEDFDLVDFLQILTERCVELLGADAAGLMLADQRGGLRLMTSTGTRAQALEVFELQTQEGPCPDCFATGEQVVNVDLAGAGQRWPVFTVAAAEAGYGATHALPLRLRGQVIGAINLFTDAAVHLDETDVAVGQAMADIATIGLLQERSSREQLVLSEQLQAALSSRVLIEQAKGVLAASAGLSVHAAFARIRTYARGHGQTLVTVAQMVLDGSLRAEELARR